jgi:long-chain acyl-CoA synthetase
MTVTDRTRTDQVAAERPWVSHYDPGVPPEVEIPAISVDGILRESAKAAPDRAALIFFGKATTYGELDRQVDRFAHALRAMGVQKGDRVSFHLPTSPAFVIGFMGAMRAGALAVPMNPLYVERELGVLFEQTEPKVSVTLDVLVPRLRALEGAGAGAGRPGRLVTTGIQDSLPVPIKWLYPIKARREGRWNPQPHSAEAPNFFRLLGSSPDGRFESAASPDDVAVLQPTGGTTGIPKAAMLTHRNLVANAIQVDAWFPRARAWEHSTVLSALPFFHIYGLTVDMNYGLLLGATLVLLPRFDPEQVLETADRYHPQLFPGAPTMYDTIARHPHVRSHDLSSIEACISGAAPLPPEVQRDFESITGGRVSEGYGLTEAAPVTHCNPIDGDRRLGTIGLPFPSTAARVVDPETGYAVRDGIVGELEVAGPQVMAGYWHRPDETAAVLRGGWLRTGDLATRDEDGYFTIVDRAKDLIIVGGVNVYPREVEEVLLGHPDVVDAAVVGVPDSHYGEVPFAFVVLRDGAAATVEELVAHCRTNLARFKVPRMIETRPSLPKTMIGKILRKDLRADAAAAAAAGGAETGRAGG